MIVPYPSDVDLFIRHYYMDYLDYLCERVTTNAGGVDGDRNPMRSLLPTPSFECHWASHDAWDDAASDETGSFSFLCIIPLSYYSYVDGKGFWDSNIGDRRIMTGRLDASQLPPISHAPYDNERCAAAGTNKGFYLFSSIEVFPPNLLLPCPCTTPPQSSNKGQLLGAVEWSSEQQEGMLPWCSNPSQVRALDLGEMTIDAFSSQLTTHNIYCSLAFFLPMERNNGVVSEDGPSRSSNYFYLPPDWTANNQQTTNISVCTTTHQQQEVVE